MEAIDLVLGQPIAQLLIGAVIGAVVSAYFAKRSSAQLAREADRIRSHINELAHLMHEAGVIEVTFDANDNLVKVVRLCGSIGGSGSLSGNITVGKAADETPAQHDPPDSQ